MQPIEVQVRPWQPNNRNSHSLYICVQTEMKNGDTDAD